MGGVNLADDQTLTPIHRRTYDVQAFKRNDTEIVLQGSVQDVKPPGLYIEGDPDSLTIHHMIVTLTVTFPVLMITDATVEFAEHPHLTCPNVVAHYGELIGLSIARGFTHKVRELFGGPRGCTHTTALLQAMAPVAVQCNWSMQLAKMREMGGNMPAVDPERRLAMAMRNVNTCHVWAEDGDHVNAITSGETTPLPINVTRRLVELGRKPESWLSPNR